MTKKIEDELVFNTSFYFKAFGEFEEKLFRLNEIVWEILPAIEGYLKQNIESNLERLYKEGPLVKKTIIVHEEKIIEKGFLIKKEAGKYKVYIDNTLIEGAAICFEGAIINSPYIYIGKDSYIEPGAMIDGPTFIGDKCQIRHSAYIRGDAIISHGAVVGHTTEVKRAIFLQGAKAGHFAYVGDSILGNDVNLGAGTKLANFKFRGRKVTISLSGKIYSTGLRKLGAIIGDKTETGCNVVMNPGTLMGPSSFVLPGVSVEGGCYPKGTIIRQ